MRKRRQIGDQPCPQPHQSEEGLEGQGAGRISEMRRQLLRLVGYYLFKLFIRQGNLLRPPAPAPGVKGKKKLNPTCQNEQVEGRGYDRHLCQLRLEVRVIDCCHHNSFCLHHPWKYDHNLLVCSGRGIPKESEKDEGRQEQENVPHLFNEISRMLIIVMILVE